MAKKNADENNGPASTIWLRPQRRKKAVPTLNRERIVKAAIELLDQSGLEGLTIRRLADRLGVGAATLYWHVDTRDDVLELALDVVLGEVPIPDESTEHWQKALVQFFNGWRVTLLRHPWSTYLFGFRPLLGPNALERSEYLRATLTRSGIGDADVVHAAYTLSNFVLGSVATQVSWQSGDEATARKRTAAYLLENSLQYPTLTAQLSSETEDWNESFQRGLYWIIGSLTLSSKN